jgi:4-diphosphocytidyl-2-C-methyl-D-erythritol kinase
MEEKAEAKINLSLKVLSKRPDGYHNLLGLMARLVLGDSLIWLDESPSEDRLDLRLEIGPPFNVEPSDLIGTDNLILKALKAFRDLTGQPKEPAAFLLIKRIPVAAGLGGGSTDAAALLRMLASLYPISLKALRSLALKIGADCPFFLLVNPLAIAEGKGEKLRPFPEKLLPGRYLVLVNPGFQLATSQVFQQLGLTFDGHSSNKVTKSIAPKTTLASLPLLGDNDLLGPALELRPALAEVREKLASLDPKPLAFGLSGSGPTFWALYGQESETIRACQALEGLGWWVKPTCLSTLPVYR